jgi:hypothetical protein
LLIVEIPSRRESAGISASPHRAEGPRSPDLGLFQFYLPVTASHYEILLWGAISQSGFYIRIDDRPQELMFEGLSGKFAEEFF